MPLTLRSLTLAAALLLLAAPLAAAAPGDLDPSFDGDGLFSVDLAGQDEFTDVLVQPDGKLVFPGRASAGGDLAVVRLNPNGTGDTSFDLNGVLAVDFGGAEVGEAAALQPDGKIVTVGATSLPGVNFAITRMTPGGALDPTFDGDGMLTLDYGGNDWAHDVFLQPDGKIVIAGYGTAATAFVITRLNPDGSPDTSFDGDGMVSVDFFSGGDGAYGAALLPGGGIVVSGTVSVNSQNDLAMVQLRADGSFDPSFNGDGRMSLNLGSGFDLGRDVLVQPDGKIVVAGNGSGFHVARLNPDGSPDTAFDGDGIVTVDFGGGDYAYAIALQANGKLVVAGQVSLEPAVARLQPGGSLDTTFSFDGKATFPGEFNSAANAVALQRDGRIVLAGRSGQDTFAARVEGDPAGVGGGPGGPGGGGPGGGGPGGGPGGGVPRCAGKRATIVGTARSDRLKGTRRADVIVGLGGSDRIAGGRGNDVICAGNGNDRLDGGAGNDGLNGGLGNDRLLGQNGNDKLGGAAGKDSLSGGGGKDNLAGGSGKDTCAGNSGKDRATCERGGA